MRLRPLALLSAAAIVATTTACVSTPEETRPQPRPSVSKEEVTPIETPDDAPKVSIVDSSPGGAKDVDPLWQGLAEAAEKKTEAYLKVYVHTGNPEVPESGETTVTADSPDSVSVTVDAKNVDDGASPFLLITAPSTSKRSATRRTRSRPSTTKTSPSSTRRARMTRSAAPPMTLKRASALPPTTSQKIPAVAKSSASSGAVRRACGGASRRPPSASAKRAESPATSSPKPAASSSSSLSPADDPRATMTL